MPKDKEPELLLSLFLPFIGRCGQCEGKNEHKNELLTIPVVVVRLAWIRRGGFLALLNAISL